MSVDAAASKSDTCFLSFRLQTWMAPRRFPKPPSSRRFPCGLNSAVFLGPVPKSKDFSQFLAE